MCLREAVIGQSPKLFLIGLSKGTRKPVENVFTRLRTFPMFVKGRHGDAPLRKQTVIDRRFRDGCCLGWKRNQNTNSNTIGIQLSRRGVSHEQLQFETSPLF